MLTATDIGTPPLSVDIPVQLEIVFNATPWMNFEDPLDVNGSNYIEPVDALRVINALNRGGEIIGEGEETAGRARWLLDAQSHSAGLYGIDQDDERRRRHAVDEALLQLLG